MEIKKEHFDWVRFLLFCLLALDSGLDHTRDVKTCWSVHFDRLPFTPCRTEKVDVSLKRLKRR